MGLSVESCFSGSGSGAEDEAPDYVARAPKLANSAWDQDSFWLCWEASAGGGTVQIWVMAVADFLGSTKVELSITSKAK